MALLYLEGRAGHTVSVGVQVRRTPFDRRRGVGPRVKHEDDTFMTEEQVRVETWWSERMGRSYSEIPDYTFTRVDVDGPMRRDA